MTARVARFAAPSAVIVLAISIVACGGRGTAQPGAPSSAAPAASAPAAAAGATISGTVVGMSAASGWAIRGSGLSVQVSGTSSVSTIDDNGRFVLQNVPGGHVDLHFTGRGIDAHLVLDGVAPHQTLTITVRLSANGAQLENDHRAGDDADDDDDRDDDANRQEAEVKGVLSLLAGSCAANNLSFHVGATTVRTNASTQFKDTTCGALKAGDTVEVKGAKQADASVLASRVERRK
jgi:Domain of unknown function (DUF5666)